MKTEQHLAAIPFPDEHEEPDHAEMLTVIGPILSGPLTKLHQWIESLDGQVYEHKFSVAVGWYEIAVTRQRRVYYFIPKYDDFLLNLIIGPRAIMSLVGGAHSAHIAMLLKNAKHFPEGTLFSFDGKSFDPELVIALCQAKLSRR